MAKKKKSKNKQQLKKSETALIMERARKLPITHCYINSGWKESGMAIIVVAREHVNGNLTMGFFQVDLFLKGVKDAFTRFNIPKHMLMDDLDDLVQDYTDIDYYMAHNIIYGAVEYAEDFGFFPCKEWKVARHILEEDTEDIPLIEIEFGKDGKPVIMDTGPYFERDIKILEKTAGHGNYHYINSMGNEGYNEWDEDDMDEEEWDGDGGFELEDDEFIESVREIVDGDFDKFVDAKYTKSSKSFSRFLKDIEKGKNEPASIAFINMLFFGMTGYEYFKGVDVIYHAIGERELLELENTDDMLQKEKIGNDHDVSRGHIEEVLKRNPGSEFIYLVCFNKLVDNGKVPHDEIIEEALSLTKKFPESTAAVSTCLLWLAMCNREDEFLNVFEQSGYVEKILSGQEGIDEFKYIIYCIVRSFESMFRDNLKEADRYYMAARQVAGLRDLPYLYLLAIKLSDLKNVFMMEKIEEFKDQMEEVA